MTFLHLASSVFLALTLLMLIFWYGINFHFLDQYLNMSLCTFSSSIRCQTSCLSNINLLFIVSAAIEAVSRLSNSTKAYPLDLAVFLLLASLTLVTVPNCEKNSLISSSKNPYGMWPRKVKRMQNT